MPRATSITACYMTQFSSHETCLLLFFVFCPSRAAPEAYGGSQARGRMGAIAAGLCHSHRNARSEPRLQPTPQLMATWILNPLSEARDPTHNLMVPSQIRFRCTMTGTPGNLKTTSAYPLSVLKARNLKSRCQQGHAPFEGSNEESFLASSTF